MKFSDDSLEMKIALISTNIPKIVLSGTDSLKEAAEKFSALMAATSYTKYGFYRVIDEDSKKTEFRKNLTLENGHHSVYEFPEFVFEFVNIPKALAMVLNNEKQYTTIEKSARRRKMHLSQKEEVLYHKWKGIFSEEIRKKYPIEKYPNMSDKTVNNLAKENARYITSVFTKTIMDYKVNFRQLNYLMHFFDTFIETAPDTDFNFKLKNSMSEFNDILKNNYGLYEEKLNPNIKERTLSFFAQREHFNEFFDELYSTTYKESFAALAQAQRHRTLNYEIQPVTLKNVSYFVPPIITSNGNLTQQWLNDLNSLKENFPQAQLLEVHETGTYQNFISKMAERLCGFAQLEIMLKTKATLKSYLKATEKGNPELHDILTQYSHGCRATFPPDFKCPAKYNCPVGPKEALDRLI